MTMPGRVTSSMFLIMILTGCMKVGPDYVRPEVPVYRDWNTRLNGDSTTTERDVQTLATWWTTLDDPILSGLIDRAVAGNLDLKVAQARVREARARRGIAAADLMPSLDGSASATWSRTITDAGPDTSGDLFTTGLDAGWELIFSAAFAAPSRQRKVTCRQAGRACATSWCHCWQKWL